MTAARWRGRFAAPADEAGVDARIVERARVATALAALPARQRLAVVLRFYEDLSEAEAAEVMGCRTGTVKSMTSRGAARLRELLGEVEE